jgi:hypothetical protein
VGQNHEQSVGVQRFQEHLFEHVEPLLEPGVHIADSVNGTGNILVRSPLHSAGANNARVHFLAPGDIVLLVTTNPAETITLLDEEIGEWPALTTILTTKEDPLADISGIDVMNIQLEVVQLDRRLGLSDLGETISRVLQEQETTNGKITVEFDILSEIIEKFDVQTVFKFLHVLTNRIKSADALSHFYVDPSRRSMSTINVLDQLFDLSITAHEHTFVADNTGVNE